MFQTHNPYTLPSSMRGSHHSVTTNSGCAAHTLTNSSENGGVWFVEKFVLPQKCCIYLPPNTIVANHVTHTSGRTSTQIVQLTAGTPPKSVQITIRWESVKTRIREEGWLRCVTEHMSILATQHQTCYGRTRQRDELAPDTSRRHKWHFTSTTHSSTSSAELIHPTTDTHRWNQWCWELR